jgi:hypothetical protein
MEKYGMFKQVLFQGLVTTGDDPEYGLSEANGNMPKSIWDWNSPSKDDTPKDSPKNTAKVTLALERTRKLLRKKTSPPRKNAFAQSRAEWLKTTKGENTRKKSTRKKTILSSARWRCPYRAGLCSEGVCTPGRWRRGNIVAILALLEVSSFLSLKLAVDYFMY